jgi:hypothetical protein
MARRAEPEAAPEVALLEDFIELLASALADEYLRAPEPQPQAAAE